MSLNFKNSGFSLIELLVSIGIVTMILGIVVSNQSTYTEGAALRNHADTIAVMLSQAQVYGVGVRERAAGSGDFSSSYGVEFNPTGGSNDAFIFFADRGVKNGRYDNSWSCPTDGFSECLEKITLSGGNTVSRICLLRSAGAEICPMERMSITFTRPETDARIIFFNNGGNEFDPGNTIGGRIELMSPRGQTVDVLIYETGQISVQ